MTSTTATGTALKALRTAAGMTLEEVAAASGAGISYLSRAENGQVVPRESWVKNVVDAIGAQMQKSGAK